MGLSTLSPEPSPSGRDPRYVFSSAEAVRTRFASLLEGEPAGLESVVLLVAEGAPADESSWASRAGIRVLPVSRGLSELDWLSSSPPVPQ